MNCIQRFSFPFSIIHILITVALVSEQKVRTDTHTQKQFYKHLWCYWLFLDYNSPLK